MIRGRGSRRRGEVLVELPNSGGVSAVRVLKSCAPTQRGDHGLYCRQPGPRETGQNAPNVHLLVRQAEAQTHQSELFDQLGLDWQLLRREHLDGDPLLEPTTRDRELVRLRVRQDSVRAAMSLR